MSDLFLNDAESKTLAWIHSNKFITTNLFHKKFMAESTFSGACKALNKLVARGLLKKNEKAHIHADSFYSLHRSVISRLKESGLVLTAPEVRAAHIKTYEKGHDKSVIEIRIAIEKSPGLENFCWLSDYEMRIGLQYEWKEKLLAGRGGELRTVRLKNNRDRTPDGYFEAVIKGKKRRFVLEYVDSPYSNDRVDSMVRGIYSSFPNSIKLVVHKDLEKLLALKEKLSQRIAEQVERASWVFAPFEKVTSLPFLKTPWVDLDRYYLSFLDEEAGQGPQKF